MTKLDNLDKLFVVWAFFFQIALIMHFALRKPFYERYTLRYGWIIYALCIQALIISIILMPIDMSTGNYVSPGFMTNDNSDKMGEFYGAQPYAARIAAAFTPHTRRIPARVGSTAPATHSSSPVRCTITCKPGRA